jgi:hypothetical protein
MATRQSIRPAIVRGSLFFFLGDVGFSTLRAALCALSAVECHRLDLIDTGGAA